MGNLGPWGLSFQEHELWPWPKLNVQMEHSVRGTKPHPFKSRRNGFHTFCTNHCKRPHNLYTTKKNKGFKSGFSQKRHRSTNSGSPLLNSSYKPIFPSVKNILPLPSVCAPFCIGKALDVKGSSTDANKEPLLLRKTITFDKLKTFVEPSKNFYFWNG